MICIPVSITLETATPRKPVFNDLISLKKSFIYSPCQCSWKSGRLARNIPYIKTDLVNIAYGTCYLFMLFIQSSFNMTKT